MEAGTPDPPSTWVLLQRDDGQRRTAVVTNSKGSGKAHLGQSRVGRSEE